MCPSFATTLYIYLKYIYLKYKRQRPERQEIFDFKNVDSQTKFTNILNSENNLSKCFNNNEGLERKVQNWLGELNKVFSRSFKKIRQNGKIKESEVSILQKKVSEILQSLKKEPNNESLKEDLEKVISKLTTLIGKQNRDKIVENFQMLDQSEDENFSNGIWKIKKKEFPKNSKPAPAAKVDINGRLVTDPIGLKKLYSDTFEHRLRQRPIKEEYSELFELQKLLLEKRLTLTIDEKSPDWTENDVIAVLKSLKNGKSRDPLGMINEIFKPPVVGYDLVKSLTIMMNRIKNEVYVPELFRMKNITAIYKNKGSRSELENDRGIFSCTIPNIILQKLIYKDNYENIDNNLSDSNVGARKGKNIRNHSFIINGIIHETVSSKSNHSYSG